jgi:hypothetical protein
VLDVKSAAEDAIALKDSHADIRSICNFRTFVLKWLDMRTCHVVICIVAILVTSARLSAAPKVEEDLPPRLDSSISKGLTFLARQQTPEGALDRDGPKVATTSLGVLAFLAAGQVPDLGKYGLTVRNAIDWLLSQQASDGYFGSGEKGMYTHAITTLALAEAYGVESSAPRRVRLHAALVKANGIILSAQNAPKSNPIYAGGWRYERNSPDSDMSLCGWNVLALRAAEDIGIDVPPEARKHAAEFVGHCYDENSKGFAYQPGGAAQTGDDAIAILCLYMLDAADENTPRLDAAVKYLETHPIEENFSFAYYATYYVAQAAFQRGGEAWTRLGRLSMARLIAAQEKDGGWPASKSGQEPGRVYATAMALGTLALPYRLLPVYQR